MREEQGTQKINAIFEEEEDQSRGWEEAEEHGGKERLQDFCPNIFWLLIYK